MITPITPVCRWLHRHFGWFSPNPEQKPEREKIKRMESGLDAELELLKQEARRVGLNWRQER